MWRMSGRGTLEGALAKYYSCGHACKVRSPLGEVLKNLLRRMIRSQSHPRMLKLENRTRLCGYLPPKNAQGWRCEYVMAHGDGILRPVP
jgi:hypothetical protein